MSDLLLYTHIFFSTLALCSGAAALIVKKGSRLHRRAGQLFVLGMCAMALSALPLALILDKVLDAMSSLLVCYLVLTSIRTFAVAHTRLDMALTGLGVAALAGYLWVEYQGVVMGVRVTDAPAGVGYVFALILLGSVAGDAAFRVKGGYQRTHRLIRHLWRMNFAFFMATVSFFLVRIHLFPEFFLEFGLLFVLGFAPLIMMLFWLGHTLLTAWQRQSKLATDLLSGQEV